MEELEKARRARKRARVVSAAVAALLTALVAAGLLPASVLESLLVLPVG